MLVLAHRGMGKGRFENTLISFKEGLGYGAHGIETDVRLTKDGVVIVNHDADLKRTLGLNIKISELSLEELRSRDLLGEDRLITLRELYNVLPEDRFFDIEIKDPRAVEGVIEIVKEFHALDRTMFSSFHHECLLQFKEAFGSSAVIAPLVDKEVISEGAEDFLFETIRRYAPASLNPNKELFSFMGIEKGIGLLERIRKAGVKIALWTLNDPTLFLQVRDVCDFLITDRSDLMVEALNSY